MRAQFNGIGSKSEKDMRPKRRCISVRSKEGQAVLANESLCMRKAMHMLQLLVAFASAHNQPLAL